VAAPAGAGPATRPVSAAARTATMINDVPRHRDLIAGTSRWKPQRAATSYTQSTLLYTADRITMLVSVARV
jgi:hypothetical protein